MTNTCKVYQHIHITLKAFETEREGIGLQLRKKNQDCTVENYICSVLQL